MREKIIFIILFIILISLFFADLMIGNKIISLKDIFNLLLGTSQENYLNIIFYEIRLPKSITAILVGSSLSISGLQMQTMFRNPLAGPYILGISSGASLGVALLVLSSGSLFGFHLFSLIENWSIIISACLGSAIILILIMFVSLRVQNVMTVLILGIMFASATSAIVNILQYFSTESSLKSFVIWSMGSLMISKTQLLFLFPFVIIGLFTSLFSVKILNVLLLGEEYAKTMGLNISLARFIIFGSTSLLAGSITAFCGPIGFVGIAVPHISRFLFKTANHHILLLSCILIGAIMMLFSDIISQLPKDFNLPINAVTALLGIPIVIIIVIKRQ